MEKDIKCGDLVWAYEKREHQEPYLFLLKVIKIKVEYTEKSKYYEYVCKSMAGPGEMTLKEIEIFMDLKELKDHFLEEIDKQSKLRLANCDKKL